MNDSRLREVASWRNICQLGFSNTWGRYVPAGLCTDGTVKVVTKGNDGQAYGEWDVTDWTGVKTLYSGTEYTIGLREDGSLLVTGGELSTLDFLGEIAQWTDIQALSFGVREMYTAHVVGLKTDGTVVAAGLNDYGQCEVGA